MVNKNAFCLVHLFSNSSSARKAYNLLFHKYFLDHKEDEKELDSVMLYNYLYQSYL